MVVEYLRYRIPTERSAAFEAAYSRAAQQLSAAPECVDYELHRSVKEPENYILRITWTSAEDHPKKFRGGPHFPAFLAEIEPYIPNLVEMDHYDPTPVHGSGGAVPTLYDWAGGHAAFDKLTDAFYREVRKDELIGPLFAHMDPDHPHFVAMWLGEVFGGPAAYSSERGDYRHMVSAHLGKHISEAQRRRWVNLLMDAADEVGLPSDPEFRAAFASYIEWGTRLAEINSQPGREAYDGEIPHWGWGVKLPYRG
ncbi:group II truncated hemoglobin [Nocardia stercoris]|uniref:Antibiotic biosynthesis monooxygenase n=1 Tax=Nocardia stercoris TaxID=2483361 RepID=A0A3M2LG18_9NOCA|nr:antibiotic biosynthesis monooxygenase [Nocardia stercoris]RMI34875.1 antibiotic biosynthesis monooxygenase [Nocardia stercoris]